MGNQNSGRRPQPTALKVLRGNPGKRKPNENEVRPPAGDPVKPAGLSPGASAVWDGLAPVCIAMGTLTAADALVFGTMCELQSSLQVASSLKDNKKLATLAKEDHTDPDSELIVVIDSVLKTERDTANTLRPYYALFGLEPISRAKIQVAKPADAPASKWAGVLK